MDGSHDRAPPIDEASAPLDERDLSRLRGVGTALRHALALKSWWTHKTGGLGRIYEASHVEQIRSSGVHPESFPLLSESTGDEFAEDDLNYGFFDRARVDRRDVEVMGAVQQMFYDRPRVAPAELDPWCRDLHRFVFGAFLGSVSIQKRGEHLSSVSVVPLFWGLDIIEFTHMPEISAIHRHFPSRSLGGALGLPDFHRDHLLDLMVLGFDDAVEHDCAVNGCVVRGVDP